MTFYRVVSLQGVGISKDDQDTDGASVVWREYWLKLGLKAIGAEDCKDRIRSYGIFDRIDYFVGHVGDFSKDFRF